MTTTPTLAKARHYEESSKKQTHDKARLPESPIIEVGSIHTLKESKRPGFYVSFEPASTFEQAAETIIAAYKSQHPTQGRCFGPFERTTRTADIKVGEENDFFMLEVEVGVPDILVESEPKQNARLRVELSRTGQESNLVSLHKALAKLVPPQIALSLNISAKVDGDPGGNGSGDG